jgi:hypothetical protein
LTIRLVLAIAAQLG